MKFKYSPFFGRVACPIARCQPGCFRRGGHQFSIINMIVQVFLPVANSSRQNLLESAASVFENRFGQSDSNHFIWIEQFNARFFEPDNGNDISIPTLAWPLKRSWFL